MRYPNRHIAGRPKRWTRFVGYLSRCPGCENLSAKNHWIAGICRTCFRNGVAYPVGNR